METADKTKLIIFTAPSGAGKTTIVHRLLDLDKRLAFSVSACTRPKRDYEIDGKHYHFIAEKEFKHKIEKGEFIEWEEVYSGIFYGTLISEVERLAKENKTVVFDIDVKGALNIKKKYGSQALSIFVKPPSVNALKERLKRRNTESDASLTKRLERAAYEMTFEKMFDKVILNDNLDRAVTEAEIAIGKFLEPS